MKIRHEIEKERKITGLQFSFSYWKDLDEAYAFYCARYENITYEEFLELPYSDFLRKLQSIPETEPLYTIMKARGIKLSKIKDKEERKYWEHLKREYKIPYAYYNNSSSSIQIRTHASEGIIKSPRGDTESVPTFGPSGKQERLNCCAKNLR